MSAAHHELGCTCSTESCLNLPSWLGSNVCHCCAHPCTLQVSIVSGHQRRPPTCCPPFLHVHLTTRHPALHLRACRFITCFVTVFATVIAITKDLPDIEGDKQFGIETFATRMGVR